MGDYLWKINKEKLNKMPISKLAYVLNKAYKDFVHLEGFIITIMNILVQ